MSISLLQELVVEERQILNEIGEANTKLFPWNKTWYELGNSMGWFIIFAAPIDLDNMTYADTLVDNIPMITVSVYDYNNHKLGLAFTANEVDDQDFKSTAKYYLMVLSTIVNIVDDFTKKYQSIWRDTNTVEVIGVDKSDVRIPGQKNRIYFAYLEKWGPKYGFQVAHSGSNKLIMTRTI